MTINVKKYYLFMDESGDHGLINVDENFPVFLLCGLLISNENYEKIRQRLNKLKHQFWGDKKVILHSRVIRKHEKEFSVLFDMDIKRKFYSFLNDIIKNTEYRLISSAIKKESYIKKYGKLSDDVYEKSLSFILERTIFSLDETKENKELEIIIEKRGKSEDKKLRIHFERLLGIGTNFITPERFKNINVKITFRDKKENVNGLQLADLLAYPQARHVIDPKKANQAYEVLKGKIYTKNNKRYGLKIFP